MKKNSFTLVFILLLITTVSFSQDNSSILMPYLKGELYGYANSKGEITIEPKYDYVTLFENGFAQVRLNSKWGLINKNGELINELMVKTIFRFDSNGLASLSDYNKYGIINKQGDYVVPLEYYGADVTPNFIQLRNSIGQLALLDLKGKTIIDFKYHHFKFSKIQSTTSNAIIVKQDNLYGLIQIKKNKAKKRIAPQYESLELFNNQVIIAEQNEKFGLIDYKNTLLLPFDYDKFKVVSHYILAEQNLEYEIKVKTIELDNYYQTRDFNEIEKEYDDQNKIVYFLMTQKEQDRLKSYGVDINERPHIKTLYSLINEQAKIIIPAQPNRIMIKSNNLIHIQSKKDTKLYNSNGKLLSSSLTIRVDEFKEGLILVKLLSEEFIAVHSNDRDIERNRDSDISKEAHYNSTDFKFGFIDTTGKVVIPFIYNGAYQFNKNRAPVKLHGKWGLINKNGDLITDYKYERLHYVGGNRYAFKLGKKWGLLNLNGTEIIPATYYAFKERYNYSTQFGSYSPFIFKNGKAKVAKLLPGFRQKSTTFIDTNGIQLFPFKYTNIEETEGDLYKISIGASHGESERHGLMDKNGNEMVPVYQSGIWWLENEKVYVVSRQAYQHKYDYYDRTGQKTDSPYKTIKREGLRDYKMLSTGYYSAKYKSKTVYFTPQGIPLYEN